MKLPPLLVALAVNVVTIHAQGSDTTAALSRLQDCGRRNEDVRLDPIRPVFPLDGGASDAMLSARVYPTKAQVVALKLWRSNVQDCMRQVVREETSLTAQQQRANLSQDLKLNLLLEGKLTFGEYALLKRVETESDLFWMSQISETRQKAINEPRPLTGLACTFETGQAAGIEIFVQFDEAQQKVWANRGSQITRSWINDSSIGYQQDKSTFTISRITGSIGWTADGVGVMSTGHCVKGTAQKF